MKLIKQIVMTLVMAVAGVSSADIFVNGANTSPEAPYDSPAKAATTITQAVTVAKEQIDAFKSEVVVIHVANGTYDETGFVLDGPIVIEGESRDGVIINDDVVGNRAFTLSHADAIVRNLTVRGPGLRLAGG